MITIEREDLRALFDLATNSMDFGSGFMNHEDVLMLRRVAEIIGANEREAIPSNFRASFAHDFEDPKPSKMYGAWIRDAQGRPIKREPDILVEVCGYCHRLEENPVHHGVSVTEPTREYET